MAKIKRQLFTPILPSGSKAQKSLYESNRRINIWEGSVRSGKTVASIIRWLIFVTNEAPEQGALVMTGKTNKTIERNILNPIIEMLGTHNAHYNRGTGEFHVKGASKPIDIIGASDERAQEKIRGATIAGAYGDEITLWPESYFKMLLSRLSVKGARLFGTTNPDSPYHWLKKDYLDRKSELNLATWHFKLEDNPFLDPEYVDSIKKEYTGLWYKRFIDGLWVLAEGAIYDMWDDKKHVVDINKIVESRGRPFRYHFVACDYGTSNPCAFGLFGYDPVRSGVPETYLIKEYYWDSVVKSQQKTDSQYADDFVAFLGNIKPLAIYVDPSAASFIAELKHRGLSTLVKEAKNSVIDGIRFVSSMLHNGKFFVDKSCKSAIEEFTCYVWDSRAQRNGEDKPLKQSDHMLDSLRYGIFSHFFKEAPQFLTGFNYD